MITPTQMYWLTRLDNIGCFSMILFLGLLTSGIVSMIVYAANHDDDDNARIDGFWGDVGCDGATPPTHFDDEGEEEEEED